MERGRKKWVDRVMANQKREMVVMGGGGERRGLVD